ncbi:MAG TPA: sulfotransferase domain-containing protein [Acetobacteraceae bacterium]|nr:sulfotransferase domain-containing protein [Acetobacteraceae bacterium]
MITSAWHFFQRPKPGQDERETKLAFIRLALPSLNAGARETLALMERYRSDCMVVTYEQMLHAPRAIAGRPFRFLGVTDHGDLVVTCIEQTSFVALSRGHPPGEAQNAAFFRKGVAGDWRSTLTQEMNELILHECGWMFPQFGWRA